MLLHFKTSSVNIDLFVSAQIDGFVHGSSFSIANALEMKQSWTKTSKCGKIHVTSL